MRLWSESQMLCRLTPDPHPQRHTDTETHEQNLKYTDVQGSFQIKNSLSLSFKGYLR